MSRTMEILDDVIAAGLARGKTMYAPEWISVKERLPEAAGWPCLLNVYNRFGQHDIVLGFTGYGRSGEPFFYSNQKDRDLSVWTVTHWRPLPEPPGETTPAADVALVELKPPGRWLDDPEHPNGKSYIFVCSECGKKAYFVTGAARLLPTKRVCRYAYCPNCGSPMETEEVKT